MVFETLDGKRSGRPPVWFMRQAGRYMAEYRALKEKYTFLQLCRTPELAARITLQPVRKFDLDAAILFSDILIPAEAMGLKLDYAPGPVLAPRLTGMESVDRLRVPSSGEFDFVKEAAAGVLKELPAGKDLIGFAGAPFTMAAYLLEGGSRPGFPAVKKAAGSEILFQLLDKIARTTVQYMNAQAEAGIRVFQFFDTWAGLADGPSFARDILPYSQRVVDAAKGRGLKVIYFFKGGEDTARALSLLKGVDAFSVDSSRTLREFHSLTGGKAALQGNLDPAILTQDRDAIAGGIDKVLADASGLKAHIFNLGHGVLPETPEDNVAFAVDRIRKAAER